MGLWGAAQAVAFGSGGLAATALSDIARHWLTSQPGAYATVFATQAAVFLCAACLVGGLERARGRHCLIDGRHHLMLAVAIDVILAFVVLEGVALIVFQRRTGRGIAPRALIGNLAAGFFLMLATRLALGRADMLVAACLLAALVAHVADLASRWRR